MYDMKKIKLTLNRFFNAEEVKLFYYNLIEYAFS